MDLNKELGTRPDLEKWYPFTLGLSLNDQSSTKFCLHPSTQPGHDCFTRAKRTRLLWSLNQPGRPKMSFEESSEDYKESDVFFF
eukprot:Gb_18549 [translate_table: standard]